MECLLLQHGRAYEADQRGAMEPVCLVCTDPLKLAAVGKCGHKNVCAKCILRLRLVLRTSECPECKEENDEVLVTTAAGSLTARPGSQPLADRAKEGDLACLDKRLPDRSPRTGMYFEDPVQMEELREKAVAKCSYPPCTKGKKEFRTVKQLEGHLWNEHGLNLCEVCLRSRRAFLQEQTLYTQQQLKHHKRHGSERDENTELGRAGFSGHPLCEFCTQRFFDSTEFFHHMEREHFRCPLCKRSDESDWTYYANYDHLERHFRSCHYLCTHSQCLERKFVVFATEAELTRHQLTEHGRKLSQTEKRQALRIDVDFNFRRAEEGQRVSPPLEGNGDQPRVAAHLPRSQPHAPAPPTDSGNEGELPQRHEDGSSSENASKPAGQSWVAAAKGRAPGRPAVRRRRQRGSDNSDAEEFPALSASTSYRNGDATSRQGESWQASSAVHRRQSSENEAAGGGTPAPGSRRSESKRERSKALRGPPPGFEGPDLGNGVDAEVFRRVGNAGYSFFKEALCAYQAGHLEVHTLIERLRDIGIESMAGKIAGSIEDEEKRREVNLRVQQREEECSKSNEEASWQCGACSVRNSQNRVTCSSCGSLRSFEEEAQRTAIRHQSPKGKKGSKGKGKGVPVSLAPQPRAPGQNPWFQSNITSR